MLKNITESFFSFEKKRIKYYSLQKLESEGLCVLNSLPYSVKILLENVLRNVNKETITDQDVKNLSSWNPKSPKLNCEIPFKPARVLLQDLAGVPVAVDLATMRSALKRINLNPTVANPSIPVELVIDHSVQVDYFGSTDSYSLNIEKEFERNSERYKFFKWAQNSFSNFRIFPPGLGIVHQVNLEYIATVIEVKTSENENIAFPDTVLGTDSHTPMVNSLGVLGWGVGGIEAEAVMLGQPYYMPYPKVVGVKLVGKMPQGSTATDLVLKITETLRKHGVVGKIVEFFGPGLKNLNIPDRATVSNMAPEYGATMGFFPIDNETLNYLKFTGRDESHINFVEFYSKEQGLFYDDEITPSYDEELEFDMSDVKPSIAGPANPEDRILLSEAKEKILEITHQENHLEHHIEINNNKSKLKTNSVVISAITSCTNTSNPNVMIGAGLLAKKAVQAGLKVQPYVKTSLAPGSRVVTDYLNASGLMTYLEQLGYTTVGYGCTTCICNSGPLPDPVANIIDKEQLYTAAVLSGNRNFAGRIHPQVKASFLMSPLVVVAYGLAGRVDIDLLNEPLGYGTNNVPIFLKDIWPKSDEIINILNTSLQPKMFRSKYDNIFHGDERWENLSFPQGDVYEWDDTSTYIREPDFFEGLKSEPSKLSDISRARTLMLFGDRVTTDHISPAGAILPTSPAGEYLIDNDVDPLKFNTHGARRGNHEVLIRGTFANVRIKNLLTPDKEGWWTVHFPDNKLMTVYDAANKYRSSNTPLIVLAGKMYGTGSSRDWAAKGPKFLGVTAVIAESYERIHKSNLIGMGILPLIFEEGQSWKSLGLTGDETFEINGISEDLFPGKKINVTAISSDKNTISFEVIAGLDTNIEVDYYQHGGILPYILRKLISTNDKN